MFSGWLQIIVVEGVLPSLLGLDWFVSLGLEVTSIHYTTTPEFEALMAEFADVFDGTHLL